MMVKKRYQLRQLFLFAAIPVAVAISLAVIGSVYAQSNQVTLVINTPYGTPVGAGSYSIGTNVTFGVASNTAACGSGCRYLFTGWVGSGAGSYTGPKYQSKVTMTSDITETATWTLQYYLNIVKYPTNSTGSVTPSSGWFNNGTAVSASAQDNTADNWYFLCWGSQQGQCDKGTLAQHTVKMTGSYTLYANYFHVGITITNTPQKDKFGNLEGNADGTYYPGDSLCSTSQVTVYPSTYDIGLSGGSMNMTFSSAFTNVKTTVLTPLKVITCFSIRSTVTYGKYPILASDKITLTYDNITLPVSTNGNSFVHVVNYNPQMTVIVTYPQYKDNPGSGGNATVYCSPATNCDPTIFYRPAVILVKYYGNCPQTPNCSNPTTAERLSINHFSAITTAIQYYSTNFTSIRIPYDNNVSDIQILAQGIPNGTSWGVTIGRLYSNGTLGAGQTVTGDTNPLVLHGFGPGYYWVNGLPSPLTAPCSEFATGTYYCPHQTAGVYDNTVGYFFPLNQTGRTTGFLEINYFKVHSMIVPLNYTEMAPSSYVTSSGTYYKFYLLPNSTETHTYLINDTVGFITKFYGSRSDNTTRNLFNTQYYNSYTPYDQQFTIHNPYPNANVCPSGDYTTVFTAAPYPFDGTFNNPGILKLYENNWPNLANDTTAQHLFLNDLPNTGNETFSITGPGTVDNIFVHYVTSQYSWVVTVHLYCGTQKINLTPYYDVVNEQIITNEGGMEVPFSSAIPIYINTGTSNGLSISNIAYSNDVVSLSLSAGLKTGGLSYVTAETPTGNIVLNQSLDSSYLSGPMLMTGFVGNTTVNIPWSSSAGNTLILTVHNVWGYSYTTTLTIPKGHPSQSQGPGIWGLESVWFGSLFSIFAVLFFMVYILKSFNVFRRTR